MSAAEEETAHSEHTEEEPKHEHATEAPIPVEPAGTEAPPANPPVSASPVGSEHPSPNGQQPAEGEMGNHAMPEEGVEAPAAEQHEHMPPPESEEHQAQAATPHHPRYGYPPEGYYPPGYPLPHPPGDGGHAGYPPRDGYPGGPPPPYGVPPHMGGYPMYSYHQPPMYPHYPGYPPPPMYGYPPPEGYADQQGVGVGPYAPPVDDVEDKEMEKKVGHNPVMPSALGSAARLKTYIKPRPPSSQDVLDRRSRKNAQSRARASKLRERIAVIETKGERNDEERSVFVTFEARRQRKNDRSRERALEKKEEIDRILAKPEKRRTKIEKQFLEGALNAKKRKNEGDRLRRQRLKELGLSSKTTGLKPGISARGPIGIYRGGMPPPGHPYGPPPMGEIPMSPMPPMGGHHHHHHHHPGVQSPGGFAAGSPGGMMPGMGFASPQHPRRGEVMETPGRQPPGPGHLPYIPPSQAYDGQPPQGGGSRVEQRRHPDGSMSISIGGGEAGAPQYPPEGEQGADLNDMLLYNDQEGGESAKDV